MITSKKQIHTDKELAKWWKKGTEKANRKVILKLMREELKPYSDLFYSKKSVKDFINENLEKVISKIKAQI